MPPIESSGGFCVIVDGIDGTFGFRRHRGGLAAGVLRGDRQRVGAVRLQGAGIVAAVPGAAPPAMYKR